MIKDLVSIITPSYNTANFIRETIESVLSQTYKDFELIVVDDCSEDDTEEIVKGYSDERIRFYKNERRSGAAISRNKALKLANESDVVIIGSAPEIFIKERIRQNKIIFRYSERIFKKGRYRIFSPRAIKYLFENHTKNNNKRIYMLCSSAYTAKDFALAGIIENLVVSLSTPIL